MLCDDRRRVSSIVCSPVALLTPCGIVMTRPALKIRTRGNWSVRMRFEQHRRFVRIGIDQALSRLVRDTPPTQLVQESARHHRRECRGVAARRKVKDGAILGHDAVNETQIAGDPAQLVENPSGHEQDRNASRPRRRYRPPDQRTDRIVARRGSVVVQGKHRQFHEYLA